MARTSQANKPNKKSNLLDLFGVRLRYTFRSSRTCSNCPGLSRCAQVERRRRHFLPAHVTVTHTQRERGRQVSRRRLHLTRCGHVAVVVAAHLPAYVARRLTQSSFLACLDWLATNQIRMRLQLVVERGATCPSFLKHPHISYIYIYILQIIVANCKRKRNNTRWFWQQR